MNVTVNIDYALEFLKDGEWTVYTARPTEDDLREAFKQACVLQPNNEYRIVKRATIKVCTQEIITA